MLREILARAHFLRLLAISQFDLQLIVRRPPVVSKQRDARDSSLLELLLSRTHATDVDKEAEGICFLVLMSGMCVVENDKLAGLAVRLLVAC